MRRAVVALLLLPALLAPVSAHAQGPGHDQEGTVVARQGEVTLSVHDEGRDLCVDLRAGGSGSGTCQPPPDTRFEGSVLSAESGDRTRTYAGGAVPAGTASVELEYARGARVAATVVSDASYTGRHRGKAAFFLVETTAARVAENEEPVLVRRLDASGALIGAFGGDRTGAPVAGPVTLLRRRARGDDVRVTVAASRTFLPSPIQFDRMQAMLCLEIERRNGGSSQCQEESGHFPPPLELEGRMGCGPLGGVVAGLAGPTVARVELTLGSGRRVSLRPRALTGLSTQQRGVAGLVRPGEALRSAAALDAQGRVLARQQLGVAPSPRRCSRDSGGSSWLAMYGESGLETGRRPAPPAGEQVVAGSEPGPRLVARDAGDLLCVGIDFIDADGSDCAVPPADPQIPTFGGIHTTAAYTAAGGLLAPGAAGVRIELDGRDWVAAEVTDGPAYAGMYRGHVRFYLAHAPGRRSVTRIETVDAAGAVLSSFPGPGAMFLQSAILRRTRGHRIFGGRYDFRFKFPGDPEIRHRGGCVGVAPLRGRLDDEYCSDFDHETFFGQVRCAPRAGIVVGPLRAKLRGVRAELAGGGALTSRTLRVPARYGGGRLWSIEIPPSAEIVRLRFVGRPPKARFGTRVPQSVAYPVAPPREQCGYDLPRPGF